MTDLLRPALPPTPNGVAPEAMSAVDADVRLPSLQERSAGAPSLEQSYATCRALHRRHGTTYYWATRALPAVKRHHVHALYGLCRYADDVVDTMDGVPTETRRARLGAVHRELVQGLAVGRSDHPVLCAVVHTARAFSLDRSLFDRFFASMAMDLDTDRYPTWADLLGYMDGSAAVIGELMLPLLEPVDAEAARPHAQALGLAFQMTNFLRDVGEDLDRGRVYLPAEDLDRFGADPQQRRVDDAWVALCRFEIDRIRGLYAYADRGIAMLHPRSAPAIWAARRLYAEILDRIEAVHYDVFGARARVSTGRKVRVAAAEAVRGKLR